MNLKNSAYLCVACIIGIGIGYKLFNRPELSPQAPQMAQNQAQECIATISKVTAKDGTVTESTTFKAASNQAQEIKPQEALKESLSIYWGGYVTNDLKYGASLGLNYKDWDFDIDSDLNKDHRISAKKVLLRF